MSRCLRSDRSRMKKQLGLGDDYCALLLTVY